MADFLVNTSSFHSGSAASLLTTPELLEEHWCERPKHEKKTPKLPPSVCPESQNLGVLKGSLIIAFLFFVPELEVF